MKEEHQLEKVLITQLQDKARMFASSDHASPSCLKRCWFSSTGGNSFKHQTLA